MHRSADFSDTGQHLFGPHLFGLLQDTSGRTLHGRGDQDSNLLTHTHTYRERCGVVTPVTTHLSRGIPACSDEIRPRQKKKTWLPSPTLYCTSKCNIADPSCYRGLTSSTVTKAGVKPDSRAPEVTYAMQWTQEELDTLGGGVNGPQTRTNTSSLGGARKILVYIPYLLASTAAASARSTSPLARSARRRRSSEDASFSLFAKRTKFHLGHVESSNSQWGKEGGVACMGCRILSEKWISGGAARSGDM